MAERKFFSFGQTAAVKMWFSHDVSCCLESDNGIEIRKYNDTIGKTLSKFPGYKEEEIEHESSN